jgi:hypothetical protein
VALDRQKLADHRRFGFLAVGMCHALIVTACLIDQGVELCDHLVFAQPRQQPNMSRIEPKPTSGLSLC